MKIFNSTAKSTFQILNYEQENSNEKEFYIQDLLSKVHVFVDRNVFGKACHELDQKEREISEKCLEATKKYFQSCSSQELMNMLWGEQNIDFLDVKLFSDKSFWLNDTNFNNKNSLLDVLRKVILNAYSNKSSNKEVQKCSPKDWLETLNNQYYCVREVCKGACGKEYKSESKNILPKAQNEKFNLQKNIIPIASGLVFTSAIMGLLYFIFTSKDQNLAQNINDSLSSSLRLPLLNTVAASPQVLPQNNGLTSLCLTNQSLAH